MSVQISRQDPHIQKFLTRLKKAKGEDHNTYRLYERSLRYFDEWLDGEPAVDVNTVDIRDFLLDLKAQGYAKGTVEAHFMAVRKFYTTLIELHGIIDKDDHPCDGVDLKGIEFADKNGDKVHYITDEEKDQLLDNVRKKFEVRDKLIIEMFWQTGMRKNELRHVLLEDVDQEKRQIRIWVTKTGEERTVHYQPSLNRLLDLWIEVERPTMWDSEYLFPSNRSKQISLTELRRVVHEAATDINEEVATGQDGRTFSRITPHTLRHSHAVHALKSGVPVRMVQMQLGHNSIETTMGYMRLVEDDVGEAYQVFNS